jgi:hypothetical protein
MELVQTGHSSSSCTLVAGGPPPATPAPAPTAAPIPDAFAFGNARPAAAATWAGWWSERPRWWWWRLSPSSTSMDASGRERHSTLSTSMVEARRRAVPATVRVGARSGRGGVGSGCGGGWETTTTRWLRARFCCLGKMRGQRRRRLPRGIRACQSLLVFGAAVSSCNSYFRYIYSTTKAFVETLYSVIGKSMKRFQKKFLCPLLKNTFKVCIRSQKH